MLLYSCSWVFCVCKGPGRSTERTMQTTYDDESDISGDDDEDDDEPDETFEPPSEQPGESVTSSSKESDNSDDEPLSKFSSSKCDWKHGAFNPVTYLKNSEVVMIVLT